MMTIPTDCPHCGHELLVQPHCEGRTCGWVKCRGCGSTIGRNRHGRTHLCDTKTGCKEDA